MKVFKKIFYIRFMGCIKTFLRLRVMENCGSLMKFQNYLRWNQETVLNKNYGIIQNNKNSKLLHLVEDLNNLIIKKIINIFFNKKIYVSS